MKIAGVCFLLFLACSTLIPGANADGEGDESCKASEAIEKAQPKYKPSQAALTAFFKLHEPEDPQWKAAYAVLEVTDGCPLNGMYRRFKNWIAEGATAFPNLSIKTTPGMDPILQFQNDATVPEVAASDVWDLAQGDLGLARVDASDMEIAEVEELLQRRGIVKDETLADKAMVLTRQREALEEARRTESVVS